MLVECAVSMYDVINAITETLDLAMPAIGIHHSRVAYVARNIALEMELPAEDIRDITLAALVHDIGAFSLIETVGREKLLAAADKEHDVFNHSIIGHRLLRGYAPLAKAAAIIAHHHAPYNPDRFGIPLGSYVIHLAEAVVTQLDDSQEVFIQLPAITESILASRDSFNPEVLEAFERLADAIHAWVEVFSPSLSITMLRSLDKNRRVIGLGDLRCLASIFAQIIDFRCHYTATHSSGVAAVAMEIASISGFSERECRLMEIAGFLHDLGKLAVPTSMLGKTGPLDDHEWMVMRKHSYYTYSIISKIAGLEDIAVWAAHHHERLDGAGYPYQVRGEDLSKLARIMAVADVVTALSEDRPYRQGMDEDEVVQVLQAQVADDALDPMIVDKVCQSFDRINEVRANAQTAARTEYIKFYSDDALQHKQHYGVMIFDTTVPERAKPKPKASLQPRLSTSPSLAQRLSWRAG